MKLIFPFLTISLFLGAMRYPLSSISASEQQHHSFASARCLSMDQPVSFTIAANASEYCYFDSPHPLTGMGSYHITISNSSSVSVSAYNDQGNVVPFKANGTNGSTWTGSLHSISDNKRFFLALQNLSKKDVSVQCTVQNHTLSTSPPFQKSQNNSTDSVTKKPRQTSKPKSATMKNPSKKPQRSSPPKTTVAPPHFSKKPWHSSTPKYTPAPRRKKSQPADLPKSTATSESSSIKSQKSSARPFPTRSSHPKSNTNQIDHTLSRSNFFLSSHFVRMSAGYSISAFKLLSIQLQENDLALETLTPNLLSIQNNIIYAKKSGLAILRILYDDRTTTCTIYIKK